MKNVYDAVVESCDSLAWLKVGRGRLAARLWPGIRKGKARVSVRPEDVILCAGHPGVTSARNVLPGHVRSVRFVPGGADVELDVGFRLVAAITRRAAKDLNVKRGLGLFALVKATAVEPVVEAEGAVRVSIGDVDPAKIDLLRAIEREGSLSKAARELGIAYRTAWLRARQMSRLLDLSHGGKGGGGTMLTPEGLAILRRAAELER